MKLVTIGIPFFNNEKALKYAITSTIKQTYTNLEIILVNDGSTDGSLTIAEQFLFLDNRIKIINDGRNKGLVNRLNQIIDLAEGYYIARMDADDMMDPQRIEKQVSLMESNPETDVVTTGMVSLDKELTPVGKRCCFAPTPDVLKVFKNGDGLLHASMLVRASWARRNKYLEGFARAEDRELFTRTMAKSKYAIIPEPLYFYYDVQNMTLEKYLKSYESERKAIMRHWKGNISIYNLLILLARSLAKTAIVRFYFVLRLEERLLKSKNEELKSEEKEAIANIIRNFKATS